ncbi:hypothetical protein [Pseudonocardia acaciae]|uniref:hypothetical protein n=1 Tax=Pseudonocardia acaciae TaxID=551276 RepID=UPI0006845F4F|nr:hypothetical protein [Pseudonocardia acaciae]
MSGWLSVLAPLITAALAGGLAVQPPTPAPAPVLAAAEPDWVVDLSQGHPVDTVYQDGALRLTAPTGLLTLPAQPLAQPAARVTPTLDARVPPGASAEVDVRGRLLGGRWSEWLPSVPGRPTELPGPSTQLQLRVLLAGGDPTVHGLRAHAEPATNMTVAAPGEPDSFQVYATRLGLLHRRTANGHRVTADDYFVALPSRRVLSDTDGSEYSVKVCAPDVEFGPRCAWAPVWDVGPWNTRDDYWSVTREEFHALPQGLPEAQAAFHDRHNDGKDGTGRTVRNPAGIDLSDRLFRQALGLTGTTEVSVTFLWTGGRALSRVDTVSDALTVRSAPTEDAPSVGVAAAEAGVAVECATPDGWLRIGPGEYLPGEDVTLADDVRIGDC